MTVFPNFLVINIAIFYCRFFLTVRHAFESYSVDALGSRDTVKSKPKLCMSSLIWVNTVCSIFTRVYKF